MNRVLIACSILCFCLLYSCAAVIIGAGAAGAGAFAYKEGNLRRMYESEYHETVHASIDTLKSLKIPVENKIGDELKTTIKAKRPDGTQVNIEVARAGPNHTEVAIRTGNIGVFDKKTSYQIHDYILKRLNTEPHVSLAPPDLPSPEPGSTKSNMSEEASEPKTSLGSNIFRNKQLTVYFDVNTNSLSGKEIEKLKRFAGALDKRPAEKIVIVGFSGATGNPIYNKMLSKSRAETVQMYLIGKGVPADRTEIFGHGSLDFVSSNATEEGRRLNRRVEIYLEQE